MSELTPQRRLSSSLPTHPRQPRPIKSKWWSAPSVRKRKRRRSSFPRRSMCFGMHNQRDAHKTESSPWWICRLPTGGLFGTRRRLELFNDLLESNRLPSLEGSPNPDPIANGSSQDVVVSKLPTTHRYNTTPIPLRSKYSMLNRLYRSFYSVHGICLETFRFLSEDLINVFPSWWY